MVHNIVLSRISTHLWNISAGEIYNYWYKDGIKIDDGDASITYENGSKTLQIKYNNVTGHYVGITQLNYHYMMDECRVYGNYYIDRGA